MTNSRNKINEVLSYLPSDIFYLIAGKAADDEVAKTMNIFSKTCRRLHTFFQPELKRREAHQLAQYIVNMHVINVERMIKANPNLLLMPADAVVERTNQTMINFTPLQLAYCEGDDEMCFMLISFLESAYGKQNAIEIVTKQINEKFTAPSAEENELYSQQIRKQIFEILNPVIEAINNEQFNKGQHEGKFILSDATHNAIDIFRQTFAASQPQIIEKGMRFPLKIFQEFCESYGQAAIRLGNNFKKCVLLEDGVLSFVTSYVPKHDVLRFYKGLRELFYLRTNHPNYCYDILKGESENYLLNGCWFDISYGFSIRTYHSPLIILSNGVSHFVYDEILLQFIEKKMQNLQSLFQFDNLKDLNNLKI